MPDWSYAPLFRPLLFCLPPARARDLTLGLIGRLGRLPGGTEVIAFLGHMAPPAELHRRVAGLGFPTPVGIGAGLDVSGFAAPALARFEVGHLELGPVTLAPVAADGPVERHIADEAISYPARPTNPGLDALLRHLTTAGTRRVPIGVRLAHRPGAGADEAAEERRRLIAALAPHVDFFTIETSAPAAWAWSAAEWAAHLDAVLTPIGAPDQDGTIAPGDIVRQTPYFLALAPDLPTETTIALLEPALERGIAGVVVTGGIDTGDGRRLIGATTRSIVRQYVRDLREGFGDEIAIIAGGGIQQPADALDLLAAGADLVQVCSGLVYNGPGLPKRIDEALLKLGARSAERGTDGEPGMPLAMPDPSSALRAPHSALHATPWFAYFALGAGMMISGTLAWLVAARSVILPYDELFVRMTRAELAAANERLLSFMAHDRVTLAGTMISIGVLYAGLARGGVARGHHWAWSAIIASAGFGFLSFFLFLGFGYFEPLHALISLILLPFYAIGTWWGQPRASGDYGPLAAGLRNNRAWRLGLAGQLAFVLLGVGLIGGGLTIAATGITQVFVPSDLTFLAAEGPALREINPRLVPLVAHDRAGFGGALTANGIALLLTALWGIRPGARWLWWTLLLAGLPGLGGAIGVHYAVGYTDGFHLGPVWLAAVLYVVGLGLSYRMSVEGHGERSREPGERALQESAAPLIAD